jgi:hypothetical protein
MKIAIAGVPKAGKTTHALSLGTQFRSTDSLIPKGWSEASDEAASWFADDGIVEGVAVPRALRKWLAENPEGRPVDEVHWLGVPRHDLTPGQNSMARGCQTIFEEIRPELLKRGVKIVRVR